MRTIENNFTIIKITSNYYNNYTLYFIHRANHLGKSSLLERSYPQLKRHQYQHCDTSKWRRKLLPKRLCKALTESRHKKYFTYLNLKISMIDCMLIRDDYKICFIFLQF